MRKNLRSARRKALLTQEELAQKLGLTTRQYSRIENGDSFGSVPTWEKIQSVLGGTIDDLLENTLQK